MPKTFDDYLSDPDLAGEPEALREVHTIRLMIQDETAAMSMVEKIEFLNREAEAFLAPYGKTLCYDLAGQGKLKPRATVTR